MDDQVFVYVDLDGVPIKTGTLWIRQRKDCESFSFEYDGLWLNHPKRFSLDPALKLLKGPLMKFEEICEW